MYISSSTGLPTEVAFFDEKGRVSPSLPFIQTYVSRHTFQSKYSHIHLYIYCIICYILICHIYHYILDSQDFVVATLLYLKYKINCNLFNNTKFQDACNIAFGSPSFCFSVKTLSGYATSTVIYKLPRRLLLS